MTQCEAHDFGGRRPPLYPWVDMKSDRDWILWAAEQRQRKGRRDTRGDKLGVRVKKSDIVGMIGEKLYSNMTRQEIHVLLRKGDRRDFDDGTEVKASNEETWGEDPRWNVRKSSVEDDEGVEHWPAWRYGFVLVNPSFWKASLIAYVEPASRVKRFEVKDWGQRGVPAWSPSLSMLVGLAPFDECSRCGAQRPPLRREDFSPRQGRLFDIGGNFD